MEKRLTFKCWKCKKTYSLLREIGEGNPQLSVACPFCGAEGIADLDPFRKKVDAIFKDASPQNITVGETVYDLPDVLPTQPKS
jgi:DNA-directed RNA polymerase subunit RPC12/RpoP